MGCHPDVPSATICNQEGAGDRIWFPIALRDLSGDVEVYVNENAALALANLKTRIEFEKAFADGSLRFTRCNVRGGQVLRGGKKLYRILEAEPCCDIQPLTKQALAVFDLMHGFGRTTGGIVPAPLDAVDTDPFAGILASDIPARKALIFVKGTERTAMQKLGAQRKMITTVTCAFHDEHAVDWKSYRVVAFCHEDNVSDFKFDTGHALAVVTGISCVDESKKVYEVVEDDVTPIILDHVAKTRGALHAESAAVQQPRQVEEPSEKTVALIHGSHKRCRSISNYPSDPP
jgi:hypothetical protein